MQSLRRGKKNQQKRTSLKKTAGINHLRKAILSVETHESIGGGQSSLREDSSGVKPLRQDLKAEARRRSGRKGGARVYIKDKSFPKKPALMAYLLRRKKPKLGGRAQFPVGQEVMGP